jgi:metallo-beta-lactamase family protein
MEVQLFGAAKEVTGSCYSLAAGGDLILIDCGMFQGSKDNARKNYEKFDFEPGKYRALLLTHAHLDHCGRIPKLVKNGFRGKIFSTNATKELAYIIMADSAKIAAEDTKHENKRRAKEGLPPRKPIYGVDDVENAMKLFVTVSYGQNVKITKKIVARFYDAGHILGSASIQIKTKGGKIIAFSGDLGQADAIIIKNAEPITEAENVFIESTYGDRLHPPVEQRKKEFLRIINETYKRGGKLLIPSFTIERAQEILYYLGEFMQDNLIPKMKVYLDSPMAIKASKVFAKYSEYYNETIRKSMKRRKDPFNFPELVNLSTAEQSKSINGIKEPCIIIAGNGMCSAGRIKYHIKDKIMDSRNTLMFIGYQARGTLGYWIKKGEKKIKLLGTEVDVNAKIESIDGFSAHADYNGLISWLKNYSPKPKKVFITHGEEEQSLAFSKRLNGKKFAPYIPSFEEKLEL